MTRSVTSLLLILLIQCGIITAVYWPDQALLEQPTHRHLLSLSPQDIDEVRIGDEYDNEAVLQKIGGHWVLPELEHLPADPHKINKLLAAITDQDNGWPIAQSVAARQRFQVADYHYQRSLALLSANEQLALVYLGTSPAFRKNHARQKGHDDIYSITFNVFDAPGVSGAWLDPRLLQVRAPLSIIADSYSVQRTSGEWLSGAGLKPDERELQGLLSALRTMQIDGVASEDLQRDLSTTEADLVLQVQSLAGEVTLEIFTVEKAHFISSSEYSLLFRLSAYDYDRLTGIDFRLISGDVNGE